MAQQEVHSALQRRGDEVGLPAHAKAHHACILIVWESGVESAYHKLGGEKPIGRHKPLFGIVMGMRGGSNCLYVAFFSGNKGST